MPVFTYAGRDKQGRPVSGEIEAVSGVVASRRLTEREIIIYDLNERREYRASTLGRGFAAVFLNVSIGALMVFYRQLAAAMRGGMSMSQALDALSRNAPSGRLRKIVARARDHVDRGGQLSEVLAQYPWVFDRLQMALIETGEASGGMEAMLTQAAEYLERENDLRNLLRRITFYPKLVVLVAAGAVYTLSRFGMGELLRPLIGAAPWVVLAVVLGWLTLRVGNQQPAFRAAWDCVKLAVPFVGGVVRKMAAARFSSALALMFRAGVPLTRAIRDASAAAGNAYMEGRILRVAPMLDEGRSLSETLTRAGVFPPAVLSMLSTGEQTGSIDSVMDKVAEYLDTESRTRMEQIAWVVAVGLYLLAALIVLYIAVSFYSAQFGIYEQKAGE